MSYLFEVIPAIDILQGNCVRLEQGDFTRVLTYSDNPVEEAKRFERAGAPRLHIVDLEGARTGKMKEEAWIKNIVEQVSIPVQIGGGVRNFKKIEALLKLGVDRVILGTMALTDPGLVKKACKAFGNRIFISVDAKKGYVTTEGWRKTSTTLATDLAQELAGWGIQGILYTDIAKDGMLRGPNLAGIQALAASTSIPMLASGGISTYQDIQTLKKLAPSGIIGCIVGKAFYAGSLSPEEVFEQVGADVTE